MSARHGSRHRVRGARSRVIAITELNALGNVTVECLPASCTTGRTRFPTRAPVSDRPTAQRRCRDLAAPTGRRECGSHRRRLVGVALRPTSSGTDCGPGTARTGVRRGRRRDAVRCALLPILRDRTPLRRDPGPRRSAFYLTDFLVKHFDRLIWQDSASKHTRAARHVLRQLHPIVYLAQTDDPAWRPRSRRDRLRARARDAPGTANSRPPW